MTTESWLIFSVGMLVVALVQFWVGMFVSNERSEKHLEGK